MKLAMKKSFCAIVALSACLLCSCARQATSGQGHASASRKAAPEFTLTDASGVKVKLSDYKGKVVLLNFWATWCGPCALEIPWFIDFQQQYKSQGFEVLGVSMDDDGWKVVKPYVAEHKLNYRVLLGDDSIAQMYGGLDALPTTYIVDRDGKVAFPVHVGLINKSEYVQELQSLLAEKQARVDGRSLFLAPVFCWAQQNKIAVRPPDPITIKRGATVTETLQLVVPPGFHVNCDKPKDEFIIPLKLTWTPGLLDVKKVEFPKPEEVKVGMQDLLVFTGTFAVKTQFQAPSNAVTGAASLVGKIHYQACSSDMCFRPSTIEVKLPVVIE